MTRQPCVEPGCCAVALDGAGRCAVHQNITRRHRGDAPIRCYACGELIRIDRRWLVRAEGAFHLRPTCLLVAAGDYAVKVLETGDFNAVLQSGVITSDASDNPAA